ncbi:universal stress protein [Noviherbaspirillum massiliense]|uniref:universal stress protein n=1 Tax=Noviherbaspirillum massiliense TaxID=1465823 RepID=UPI0002DBDF17|nr:universal stress protein [Noviherbaspirillum massiliense]
MSYKTILVHVDESEHAIERIKIAAAVAMTENAHLIGTATTGVSRFLQQSTLSSAPTPHLAAHLDMLRCQARLGLERFEATARKIGIPSFEKRLVDDEAGGGICLQARYCDLVVIGQLDPEHPSAVVMPDFPQYVVLNSGRPVLIVPCSGRCESIGRRVLIAWDASMPATRAITNAIPLLRRAQVVEAAVFNPQAQPQMQGTDPGSGIVPYLARHGIQVEVKQKETDTGIGAALLSLAAEDECDLLIMGGYGHSRFREILLGGVTRTVLEEATIPVLMSH